MWSSELDKYKPFHSVRSFPKACSEAFPKHATQDTEGARNWTCDILHEKHVFYHHAMVPSHSFTSPEWCTVCHCGYCMKWRQNVLIPTCQHASFLSGRNVILEICFVRNISLPSFPVTLVPTKNLGLFNGSVKNCSKRISIFSLAVLPNTFVIDICKITSVQGRSYSSRLSYRIGKWTKAISV